MWTKSCPGTTQPTWVLSAIMSSSQETPVPRHGRWCTPVNPATQKAVAGGLLLPGQARQFSEALSQSEKGLGCKLSGRARLGSIPSTKVNPGPIHSHLLAGISGIFLFLCWNWKIGIKPSAQLGNSQDAPKQRWGLPLLKRHPVCLVQCSHSVVDLGGPSSPPTLPIPSKLSEDRFSFRPPCVP